MNTMNVYEKCPTLKHLSQIFFGLNWGRGGGGGGRGRREAKTFNVHEKMSNTEASFRGDGGSEADRGRREANMLNVYDKCPTLKHLSEGMGEVRQAEGGGKRTC